MYSLPEDDSPKDAILLPLLFGVCVFQERSSAQKRNQKKKKYNEMFRLKASNYK